MPKTAPLETVKSTSPEISFDAYDAFFNTDPIAFARNARKYLKDMKGARSTLADLKEEMPKFGLQVAVLFHRFVTKLRGTPEYIGKDPNEYVRTTLGLAKEDRVPAQAYANANLFLETVKPANGEPVWTELNYLACTQRALGLLSKILTHKKVKDSVDPSTGRVVDNETFKEALGVATFRARNYEKALNGILERLDGDKPAVTVTEENLANVVGCLVAFLQQGRPVKPEFADVAESLFAEAAEWNGCDFTGEVAQAPESEDPANADAESPAPVDMPDFAAHVAKIAPGLKPKMATACAKAVRQFFGMLERLPGTWDELDGFMQAAQTATAAA